MAGVAVALSRGLSVAFLEAPAFHLLSGQLWGDRQLHPMPQLVPVQGLGSAPRRPAGLSVWWLWNCPSPLFWGGAPGAGSGRELG